MAERAKTMTVWYPRFKTGLGDDADATVLAIHEGGPGRLGGSIDRSPPLSNKISINSLLEELSELGFLHGHYCMSSSKLADISGIPGERSDIERAHSESVAVQHVTKAVASNLGYGPRVGRH
eukprot:s2488_g15.t1